MLNRLHMPAGKAIALAAMPTAVLMGMGLTPQLAQAETQAKDRFKPGPCVTQPDQQDAEDERDGKGERDPRSDDKSDQRDQRDEKPGDKPGGTNEPTTPGSSTSPDGDAADDHEPAPGATSDARPEADHATQAPPKASSTTNDPKSGSEEAGDTMAPEDATKPPGTTPSPSQTEPRNPLDPLGLGDKIKDLLDGDKGDQPATPAPTDDAPRPDADASTDTDTEAGQDAGKEAAKGDADGAATDVPTNKGDAPSGNDAGDAGDAATEKKAAELRERIEKAQREAADKAERERANATEDAEGATKGEDAERGEGAEGAKDDADPTAKPTLPSADDPQPYPCPVKDEEALRNAKLEEGAPLLPEDPWILESSLLALHGLKYDGIVKVKTYSGREKAVLKFTASSIDIRDLRQTVVGPGGTKTHVDARKGSNSTMRDGTVTMYTEELKGKLLGLIPVTFSPEAPPPLTLPELFFTDVRVTQAGQLGGTLTVPGMHLYQTEG
ncbi:hydrogenase expression protein HypF [Streptomyces sp. 71268]|uniref:hydrogenase expression protein HypF n=1 Tax=Streptomyces sp. 71268 TaxID=3002640 RepID=UPI0023F98AA3|nr:hydrogenase expression protein HypF [Streptomyces sp. 71268]WEV25259.1 hydrogenase expression protein HypF [Streptomyces sp. 71268]